MLVDAMADREITIEALALMVGLSPRALAACARRERSWLVVDLLNVCDVLGLDAVQIFRGVASRANLTKPHVLRDAQRIGEPDQLLNVDRCPAGEDLRQSAVGHA